jgi:hypothetical protein
MSVGVWMVPAVLAGVVGILWAATWFERVVAPTTFAIEVPNPQQVAAAVVDAAQTACLGPGSSMPLRSPTIPADLAAALDA